MLDVNIQNFLDERKAAWLKKKINNKLSDEERLELEQQAQEEFSLAVWLPNAAKRAGQLSLVSHLGKFSHPSAKISSIIATLPKRADGFLRTGNVAADLDVFGNAAAMDVYKFLSIALSDNKTVLVHLEEATPEIEQQLNIPSVPFAEIKQGLLAIKQGNHVPIKTSARVKQVYFPIDDNNYHLLSVVTPSNLVFKLKQRINIMRFSDEAKAARVAKKNSRKHDDSLSEVYGLSVIGYGGTKPQNISVLNSQNGGTAYLLPSMPPALSKKSIWPPKDNFFTNTLWVKKYEDDFLEFHKLLESEINNRHLRQQRDWLIKRIINQVSDRLWMIRHIEPGWSDAENYQQLPEYQKIWLDQKYAETRETSTTDWLDAVKTGLARWFLNTYVKIMGDKAIALGGDEIPHIKAMIDQCEEAVR